MTQKTPPIALEDRASDGARLSSPSAARNREPIMSALGERLPDGARVLEIASGTGEHALAVVSARPDLRWTPSDPDPKSRASENAWAEDAEGRIRPALDLDGAELDAAAGRAKAAPENLKWLRRSWDRSERARLSAKGSSA